MKLLYHVSDVSCEQSVPAWKSLDPSLCRDEYYDGPLLGLRTVSTSLTTVNGELPKWTPYPTRMKAGAKLHRALMELDLRNDFLGFLLFERRGKGGVKQRQLLFCKKTDPVEMDFAKVLKSMGFASVDVAELDHEFVGSSTWVNCHFLSRMAIDRWDKVTKRSNWGPGKLDMKRAPPPEDRTLALMQWICQQADQDLESLALPDRFASLSHEPDEHEYHAEMRAARFIADLDHNYARCLQVLKGVDIDLETASLSKISKTLRLRGMPHMCLFCMREWSTRELQNHLTSDRSHIYSLASLKAERELVKQKIAEDGSTRDSIKAKIVFAVKTASLIHLFGRRRN